MKNTILFLICIASVSLSQNSFVVGRVVEKIRVPEASNWHFSYRVIPGIFSITTIPVNYVTYEPPAYWLRVKLKGRIVEAETDDEGFYGVRVGRRVKLKVYSNGSFELMKTNSRKQ